MALEDSHARKLTRRLLARAAKGDTPRAASLSAHAACERTYQALARSVGPAGAQALLMRALGSAQREHPILKNFHVGGQNETGLGGITAEVQSDASTDMAAGLEAVLENMLELLGRLVGEDMVAQLVIPSAATETQNQDVP